MPVLNEPHTQVFKCTQHQEKEDTWFFCNKIYCKDKFCHTQRCCVLGIAFPKNAPGQSEVPPTASQHLRIKEKLAMLL